MAFVIAQWDLPGTPETLQTYVAKAPEWQQIQPNFPGFVATRFLRNPYTTAPQVCSIQEFDSLDNAKAWMSSQENADLRADMRAHGCSNFTMELWDRSPLMPELLLPNRGD